MITTESRAGLELHPAAVAAREPDRPAIVMAASGETVTYAELGRRTNRLSHLLRARGVERGDGIAVIMENHPRFLEVMWAAQSSGIYYTPLNRHFTASEVAYIVENSGARVLIATAAQAEV